MHLAAHEVMHLAYQADTDAARRAVSAVEAASKKTDASVGGEEDEAVAVAREEPAARGAGATAGAAGAGSGISEPPSGVGFGSLRMLMNCFIAGERTLLFFRIAETGRAKSAPAISTG